MTELLMPWDLSWQDYVRRYFITRNVALLTMYTIHAVEVTRLIDDPGTQALGFDVFVTRRGKVEPSFHVRYYPDIARFVFNRRSYEASKLHVVMMREIEDDNLYHFKTVQRLRRILQRRKQ